MGDLDSVRGSHAAIIPLLTGLGFRSFSTSRCYGSFSERASSLLVQLRVTGRNLHTESPKPDCKLDPITKD